MIKIDFRYFSKVLDAPSEAIVLLPNDACSEEKPKPYKVLYLLHGFHGDNTSWLRNSLIELYATEYNICVVMPDAKNSFYTDMKYGCNYYMAIAKELPKLICNSFNVSDKREDTFICGLSMGGYGALKIGLRECSRFAACAGLSSVADMKTRVNRHAEFNIMDLIFGEERIVPDEDNLFYLADKMNDNADKPRIYLACGTGDALYPMNIKFKEKLESLDYDFTYREGEGIHNWYFWNEYIKYVLEWMFK